MSPGDAASPGPASEARAATCTIHPTPILRASEPRAVTLAAVAESDPWWHSTAQRALEHLASLGEPFDAYSLTELGVIDPDHPGRWGALFHTAQEAGLIERVGYLPSRRPSRAGGVCAVWVGRTGERGAS